MASVLLVYLGIYLFSWPTVDGIRIGNPVGNIGNALIIGMDSGIVDIRFCRRQITCLLWKRHHWP